MTKNVYCFFDVVFEHQFTLIFSSEDNPVLYPHL